MRCEWALGLGAALCSLLLAATLCSCAAPRAQGSAASASDVAPVSSAPTTSDSTPAAPLGALASEPSAPSEAASVESVSARSGSDASAPASELGDGDSLSSAAANNSSAGSKKSAAQERRRTLDRLAAKLKLEKSFHRSLNHGPKPAKYQKYIVLHDTEGGGTARDVLNYWLADGKYVAAHFVVNRDGSVLQCVRMDAITHHAGFGDTGHNKMFRVRDESRDDKRGTTPIGSWARDYGMNSYSIGIELIHKGNAVYPKAQLRALDRLIRYIDTYYGFESAIIDHKAWRSGNSDTSAAFKPYLKSYQKRRTHTKPTT